MCLSEAAWGFDRSHTRRVDKGLMSRDQHALRKRDVFPVRGAATSVSDCSHATITKYRYRSRAAMTCEPSRMRLASPSVIQPNICQSHWAYRHAYAYEVLFDDGDARVSRHFARLHRYSAIIRRWMGNGLLQPGFGVCISQLCYCRPAPVVIRQPSSMAKRASGIKYEVHAAVAEAYLRATHVTSQRRQWRILEAFQSLAND
jgi:hypothetical protein